ncbi:MAG: GNAT family N-acetyltransferase [Desulfobacterales bacterium]|nr:GNAT family N-acetyltransferase [Desulfobacterales bacterium]
MDINVKPLTERDDISLYRTMTFLRFQEDVDNFKPDGSLIAFKAIDANEQPIGLGLAHSIPIEGIILSVFVDSKHRNKGIGTLLFQKLEQALFDRSHLCIFVQYQGDTSDTPSFERILKKQNWTPPIVQKLICEVDRNIFKAPWIRHPISPEFSVFPWTKLTDKERSMILHKQQAEQWYQEDLSPFNGESSIEPSNSVGLSYKGEVAGWCITHRVAPNTIRYTAMFLRKDLRSSGLGILLLAESVRRLEKAVQIDKDLVDFHSIWMIEKKNDLMIKFAERYLLPWNVRVSEIKYSQKNNEGFKNVT